MKSRSLLIVASLGLLAVAGAACHGSSRITVSGLVVNQLGVPQSGMVVLVGGNGPVITGTDGRFQSGGVRTPYDVAVVNGAQSTTTFYPGLTRSDPTLTEFGPTFFGATRTGKLSGKLTGSAFPLTGGNIGNFAVSLPTLSPGLTSVATDSNGNYSITLIWQGAPALTGTAFASAFTFDPVSGSPTNYAGAATAPFTLHDGQTLPLDVALAAVPTQTVSGSIEVGGDLIYNFGFAAFTLDDGPMAFFGGSSQTAGNFSLTIPEMPGAAYEVTAFAHSAISNESATARVNGLAAGSTGASLKLHAIPKLGLPAQQASDVTTSTLFDWTPSEIPSYYVASFFSATPGEPSFFVVTTDTETTLPNIPAFPVPATQNYLWFVRAFGPVANLDEAAGAPALALWAFPQAEQYQTAERSFTTSADPMPTPVPAATH